MTQSWDAEEFYPEEARIGVLGWALAVMRGLVILLMIVIGLIFLMLLRLVERRIYGLRRPWTSVFPMIVSRQALRVLGIGFEAHGTLMKERGAVVANHSSWLDIFALNALKRVYFVSKAEVAKWPGIGAMAQATGTVFINRDPREARVQKDIFEARLMAGHKLLFFPEGTSTDAIRVLPFKPTLFAAFFSEHLRDDMYIQPVTVLYHAPKGADRRFYGWWGDMEFGPSLLKVLAARRQGRVELTYHAPLKVSDFADRKALARKAEAIVRSGHHLAQ